MVRWNAYFKNGSKILHKTLVYCVLKKCIVLEKIQIVRFLIKKNYYFSFSVPCFNIVPWEGMHDFIVFSIIIKIIYSQQLAVGIYGQLKLIDRLTSRSLLEILPVLIFLIFFTELWFLELNCVRLTLRVDTNLQTNFNWPNLCKSKVVIYKSASSSMYKINKVCFSLC